MNYNETAIAIIAITIAIVITMNYNETAVAIIAILPDDDPMWPKHVVLE
jgi:hypothetical protein